ncbi:MAG TPA: archease [Gaiellaceae bacterium]|nr:archease [Gaiellaceae bacterium]
MTYTWREHTAEIELVIDATSEEAVFADAADAFARLVELDAGGAAVAHDVAVDAPDRAALLVAWLDELIYLADVEGFVADRVEGLRLRAGGLDATLVGRRTTIDPLVKAATYHRLVFGREEGRWHARVVLDV